MNISNSNDMKLLKERCWMHCKYHRIIDLYFECPGLLYNQTLLVLSKVNNV